MENSKLMIKHLLIIFMASITFFACKKESNDTVDGMGENTPPPPGLTVEKKNIALLADFSEDWCAPCGAYGSPAFDSALSQEGLLLTGLKIYSSSNTNGLNSTLASDWGDDFNVNTIPTLYLNSIKLSVTSNIGTTYTGILQKANQFQSDSVLAGIALEKKQINDSTMQVKTRVQFFKPDSSAANYSLGVFLLEDSVIAGQSVSNASGVGSYTDPDFVHRNVLRSGNTADYLGTTVNNGAPVVVDQVFNKTFNLSIDSTWNTSRLKVIAVLWKRGSGTPKVVNSRLAP